MACCHPGLHGGILVGLITYGIHLIYHLITSSLSPGRFSFFSLPSLYCNQNCLNEYHVSSALGPRAKVLILAQHTHTKKKFAFYSPLHTYTRSHTTTLTQNVFIRCRICGLALLASREEFYTITQTELFTTNEKPRCSGEAFT